MKNLSKFNRIIKISIFAICFVFYNNAIAQVIDKEYTSLEEALKNPDQVTRLNLSDQNIEQSFKDLAKFKNLKYLSLRHTNLKDIPFEITT
jgi:Leucine-rich repeat (LRR) protein